VREHLVADRLQTASNIGQELYRWIVRLDHTAVTQNQNDPTRPPRSRTRANRARRSD
jgi:hypothetical protein